MSQEQFDWVRAAAFALILFPVLIANMRDARITNAHSALVLAAGTALLIAERMLTGAWTIAPLFWGIATVAILVLTIVGGLPGGGAKLGIGLLPWLGGWESFVAVATVGFLVTAAIGYARGGQGPLVPGFYVAGLGALVYAAV